MNTNPGASPETTKTEILEQLASLLKQYRWTLMTAESCTGGGIAKYCTDISGSSEWFEGGVVSYSNRIKTGLLGVAESSLNAHGAVSEQVASEMVIGLLAKTPAQCGIAVTGVAGPTGGTATKPVGMVWFAWMVDGQLKTECCHFDGNREAVRQQTIEHSLRQLVIFLQEVSKQD